MCCDHCQVIRRRFDFDRGPVDKIKYIEDVGKQNKCLYNYFLQVLCRVRFITKTFNNFMEHKKINFCYCKYLNRKVDANLYYFNQKYK